MSIPVTDLRPGERVTLFCPQSRSAQRKDALFDEVLTGAELLERIRTDRHVHAHPLAGWFNVKPDRRYASFISETRPGWRLNHLFELTDAGRLKDTEGRAVYIEARVAMGIG